MTPQQKEELIRALKDLRVKYVILLLQEQAEKDGREDVIDSLTVLMRKVTHNQIMMRNRVITRQQCNEAIQAVADEVLQFINH